MKPFLSSLILILTTLAAGAVPPAAPPPPQAHPSPTPTPAPSTSPAPVPYSPPPGTLLWHNGESLRGEIIQASPSTLTWKSKLFEDPLQLDWHVLHRIFWNPATGPAADPFSFTLKDGSFLYGDLVSISDDAISIHSTRHGDTLLQRATVLSAKRLHTPTLLYNGPTGTYKWTTLQNGSDGVTPGPPPVDFTPPIATAPGGQLIIRTWNRGAHLDVPLPEKVKIDLQISSTERPDFMLGFSHTTPAPSIRLQTWDDALVLSQDNDFTTVLKLLPSDRRLSLQLCWDPKNHTCSVYKPSGDLITTWKIPHEGDAINPTSNPPSLVFQNKGLNLTLESLEIRPWNGNPPSPIDPSFPSLEMSDGQRLTGEFQSGPPGTVKFKKTGEATPTDIPIANIDSLVFTPSLLTPAEHPELRLLYNDCGLLFGHLVSITNGKLALNTSFTRDPLLSTLDSPRQLQIRLPSYDLGPPFRKALDELRIDGVTLHGKLEYGGESSPRWTPIGGVAPSRTSSAESLEITRASAVPTASFTNPALFYLTSGDILPGNLKSLDRDGAEFESSLMSARKLTSDQLNAIQLIPTRPLVINGFSDPGWQTMQAEDNPVEISGNSVTMPPGSAIAFPNAMQCGEFCFKYGNGNFFGTRLRLFCAGKDKTRSMNLLLGISGNMVYSGMEATEGQFENQVQTVVKSGDSVVVRIIVGEREIELLLNGRSIQKFPIDSSKCAGSGLIIEPTGLWGNQMFGITLSDFSSVSAPGRTWIPDLSQQVRDQVLTIPRFQKDDPPRHLLLAGNGDVLRGEVLAATDAHLSFRTGLETVDIPRDRVRAILFLKPAQRTAQVDDFKPEVPSPLDQKNRMGRALHFNFGQSDLRNIMNFIMLQCFSCPYEIPDSIDHTRTRISFNGQDTLRDVLDRVCSTYSVKYRLDPSGKIIFAKADAPDDSMPTQSYWLKPDAASKLTTPKETLASKGITFPKDSAIQFSPDSGLLRMTNSPENQAKLAQLLDADFGGSEGKPTHWLLLSSGARLALAVDQFSSDFITGHQPFYGVCKVPTAEVFTIRTSAPEPTATMRKVQDWRLVNAPEPVIPEGSAGGSALVGKAAPDFKLPLLDGGDFDLSAQKGKVVVLDFWATWCAPCVKSLPGLVDIVASLPSDRVVLIGLNQGESSAQVKHFLAARGLKLTVALDADQGVGHNYGADAIPRTIIIKPDGVIAWDQTGYDPDSESEISETIKKLLQPPAN